MPFVVRRRTIDNLQYLTIMKITVLNKIPTTRTNIQPTPFKVGKRTISPCQIRRLPAPARPVISRRRIMDGGELLGTALRTRDGVKPVYVSIGHLIDLPTAVKVVLSCCRGYRLPEPQREAHRWVTELSRERESVPC